jgi:hypothetical protein
VEELDRVRIAAVLAADAELEVGLALAPDPSGEPDEPADPGLSIVSNGERSMILRSM